MKPRVPLAAVVGAGVAAAVLLAVVLFLTLRPTEAAKLLKQGDVALRDNRPDDAAKLFLEAVEKPGKETEHAAAKERVGALYDVFTQRGDLRAAKDQAELDRVWDALLDGGKAQQCGWLADRYGLHWQIVYEGYDRLMDDPAKAKAAMTEIFQMVKLDIARIEAAAAAA